MTNRLYYDDSYTTAFTARIVEHLDADGRPAVILDATYFYPTGGGQPHDLGTINGIEVVEVFPRDTDHVIVHVLTAPLEGDSADGAIDWPRRFDLMQQHTGQHILTQAFVTVAKANTIGFHLGSTVTIDLDTPLPKPAVVEQVEALVNRILIENRPVTARVIDPSEAASLGTRIRRIPGHLATGGLRVIEVQDFDLTACGGTHVARTGEIGLLKILKVENYKGGTRIEFVCGGRALQDYQDKHTLISELAAAFGSGPRELGEAALRLRADLKAAQTELKKARAALAELEVPAMLVEAAERSGVRVVRRAFADREPGEVRNLASRLTQQPGILALLGTAGEKAQLFCARSEGLPYDMNIALKSGLSVLGSDRGGGKPDFAQGGGIAAGVEQIEAALRAAEDSVMAN